MELVLEESKLKEAIKCEFCSITHNLKNNTLVSRLFEKSVLSKKEKEELGAVLTQKGQTWQSERLMEILLGKSAGQLQEFMRVLEGTGNGGIATIIHRAAVEVNTRANQQIQGKHGHLTM